MCRSILEVNKLAMSNWFFRSSSVDVERKRTNKVVPAAYKSLADPTNHLQAQPTNGYTPFAK